MRKEVSTITEEIYCDICGEKTDKKYYWALDVRKEEETIMEFGNGFKDTGDWREHCRDRMIEVISKQLDSLVERYKIDHEGNKTTEHYKSLVAYSNPLK